MNTQQLAAEMNMPLSDVTDFVNCLKVWTDKGFSIEEAITKHTAQMTRLVNNSVKVAHDPSVKEITVEAFFPS